MKKANKKKRKNFRAVCVIRHDDGKAVGVVERERGYYYALSYRNFETTALDDVERDFERFGTSYFSKVAFSPFSIREGKYMYAHFECEKPVAD